MNKNDALKGFEKWNRKIHIYLGLYMLLFIWLFSISGLFMNHPKWFHGKIERTPGERQVTVSTDMDDVAKAKDLREQLGLEGEIILRAQGNPEKFAFMVMRPHQRHAINVDLATQLATVTLAKPQPVGILADLHTFTGVRGIWNEPVQEKDWFLTRIWSFSMDALSIGLILIVISSLYMGLRIKESRRWVVASLALGTLVCSFFVWGLTLMG
ncbi:MAG: hypothetical protein O3C43_08210 [Verrucomicrobia bacterium]|nr:hypothetical protein [Verrucomicrobiota bacterium]MDA1066471.1 hypothetical protein [Verrucomicrobiota bacterium]